VHIKQCGGVLFLLPSIISQSKDLIWAIHGAMLRGLPNASWITYKWMAS